MAHIPSDGRASSCRGLMRSESLLGVGRVNSPSPVVENASWLSLRACAARFPAEAADYGRGMVDAPGRGRPEPCPGQVRIALPLTRGGCVRISYGTPRYVKLRPSPGGTGRCSPR